MKHYKGSLLMEVMVVILLMGILIGITSKTSYRSFKSSPREAPIILMGCINEELREARESKKTMQVKVDQGEITHWNDKRKLKKTVFYDEDVTIDYEGKKYFTFRIHRNSYYDILLAKNQSGLIYFTRNGKMESQLMIHLGSSTMDLRTR